MNPGRFAAAYVALWTAHDLADHVVQTDHQAAGKSTSWKCMAGHVGSYGATQTAALVALHAAGVRLRPGRVLAGLAVSLGTHAFLDRRWPVVRLLERTGSASFAKPRTPAHQHGPSKTHLRPDLLVDSEGVTLDLAALDDEKFDLDDGSRPLPLHGPYLADQALHHVCVAVAAAVIAGGCS